MAEPTPSSSPSPSPSSSASGFNTDMALVGVILIAIIAVLSFIFGNILDIYADFIEWLYTKNWKKINLILALTFSGFNAVLIGITIYASRRYAELKRQPPIVATQKTIPAHTPLPRDEVRNNWGQIRELANSTNASDWNMAILRADALLDDVLMHLGYEGTTLAERLKIVDPTKLPSLERVWSAHRLRNAIAHDPLEQHTKETIVHALQSYEKALRELGVTGDQEEV